MTACFVRLAFLPSLSWLLPFPFLRGTSTRTAAIPAQFQADRLRWQKRTMWNTTVLLLSLFEKRTAQFSLFQKSVRPDIVSSRSVQRYFLSFKSVQYGFYFLFQNRTLRISLLEAYSTMFSPKAYSTIFCLSELYNALFVCVCVCVCVCDLSETYSRNFSSKSVRHDFLSFRSVYRYFLSFKRVQQVFHFCLVESCSINFSFRSVQRMSNRHPRT